MIVLCRAIRGAAGILSRGNMTTAIGSTILEQVRSHLGDGQCSIRISRRKIISNAWTSGLEITRVDEDEGQTDELTGVVRYARTEETDPNPDITISIGDKIEIQESQDVAADTWREARVTGRFQTNGVVRLNLGAEFE